MKELIYLLPITLLLLFLAVGVAVDWLSTLGTKNNKRELTQLIRQIIRELESNCPITLLKKDTMYNDLEDIWKKIAKIENKNKELVYNHFYNEITLIEVIIATLDKGILVTDIQILEAIKEVTPSLKSKYTSLVDELTSELQIERKVIQMQEK